MEAVASIAEVEAEMTDEVEEEASEVVLEGDAAVAVMTEGGEVEGMVVVEMTEGVVEVAATEEDETPETAGEEALAPVVQ